MTTIAALVGAEPDATRGIATTVAATAGVWRWVIELADPSAGTDVEWFDITEAVTGVEYTRGADQAFGRYRASVANLQIKAGDDTFAPWNPDTSPTFGVHVELGPGLLVRGGFIRVVSAAVAEWNPRFTLKVERWGDASFARGNIRLHQIVARDTLTALVGVPIPANDEEDWSDRLLNILTDAGWLYGHANYGDALLLVPDRDAQSSAVQELDATLDPAGCIWFTNRLGQLIVTNSWIDTFHSDPGLYWADAGPPVHFSYLAEDDPEHVAYGVDEAESFGVERTEEAIINHVVRDAPGGTFDGDDPVSIERFDRKTSSQSWIVENDVVAQDVLDAGAYREYQARPIHTSRDLHGFLPAAGHTLDYQHITAIDHSTQEGRIAVGVSGVCRQYVERITPRGDADVSWDLTVIVDVFTQSVTAGASLLPVEDLALEDVDDTSAEFSWTNPTQIVEPTHTQIRLLNPASLWTTVAYPITGSIWHALDPNTDYEFQVRLIRVVDGLAVQFSPSRSYEFTTTFTTPIVVIDDEGEGDGTVTFPPPGCGSLDWELQESDDGTTWSMVDDGTVTTPPWTVDLSGYTFDPTKLYRVWQDACGDESYSNLFVGACSDPPALGGAPFDDADLVAYWPAVCPPRRIVEAITESPAILGPCFDTFVLDGDLNIVLVAAGEGAVAYGATPGTPVPGDSDCTIAAKVIVSTQPDDPVTLFGYEDLAVQAYAHGAKWALRVVVIEDGAGITTLSSGDELDFGAWYDLAAVHDVDAGDLIAYVDAVEVASTLGSVGARTNGGTFSIGQSDNGLITNCAVWDRVLAASELPGFVPTPVTVTINKGASQADPAPGGDVVFDVVFSEAVTGFATGDVTVSGTASPTTGTVVDSGDHIHFTVTVTGMSASGTVVASIGATVCTSIASGSANDASTSTDNSVAWTLGLVAWYDASDSASITASSGAVSQWSDKSGGGHHLTQGTGGAKPTTGTRTQNSKNVLDFDGGDVLTGGSLALGMTNLTIVTVFAEDTAVVDAGVVGVHNGTGDSWNRTDSLAIETGASTQHFAYVQAGVGVGFSIAPGGLSPASVKSVRKTATAVRVYSAVTGTSVQANGTITATGTASGGIVVGGYYLSGAVAGTNRLDGWIAEIRIYNRALSDAEVTAVEAELVAKWGL